MSIKERFIINDESDFEIKQDHESDTLVQKDDKNNDF